MAAIGWPLVVLVIFLILLIRRDRLAGRPFWGKKTSISWNGLNTLINELERQYIASQPTSNHDRRRHGFIGQELRTARQAINQHDEKTILQVITNLSSLAFLDDRKLAEWQKSNGTLLPSVPRTELILPDPTETASKEK